ncbi:Hachiman antiphage defense system protein HamA, partial [Bradyrhizobium sp. Bra64]|uniref:Hachiman antiphage defense system protein HamA n=1 Tax=Bradyrhizobium sp. Bra64 TaxID=2926009 RepID=UPI0021188A55
LGLLPSRPQSCGLKTALTDQALSSALKTLSDHLDAGFLEEVKALIGPKISPTDPLSEKLSWIFDANASLDEIVNRMVVPVLVAANCTSKQIGAKPVTYSAEVKSRLARMQKHLHKRYGTELDIVAIYVPLNDKDALEAEFVSRLEAFT